jgi:hypothetical protein
MTRRSISPFACASLVLLAFDDFITLLTIIKKQKWHCHSQFLRIKTKAALLPKVALHLAFDDFIKIQQKKKPPSGGFCVIMRYTLRYGG